MHGSTTWESPDNLGSVDRSKSDVWDYYAQVCLPAVAVPSLTSVFLAPLTADIGQPWPVHLRTKHGLIIVSALI